MPTTVGRLMLQEALPERFWQDSDVLTKKRMEGVLQDIATKEPEKYQEILSRLMRVGGEVSHLEGMGLKIEHLLPAKVKHQMVDPLIKRVEQIAADKSLSPDKRDELIVRATGAVAETLGQKVFEEGLAEDNALSHLANSGARGSTSSVNQMRGAPLLVTDSNDRVIPIPITSSYAEGLTPAEFVATAYGVRKGYVTIKSCLAEGTLVRTPEGPKPIESIIAGDLVWAYCRVSGRCVVSKVLGTFDNGRRPCHTYIDISTGRALLTATEDHNILVRKEKDTDFTDVLPLRVAFPQISFEKDGYTPVSAAGDFVEYGAIGRQPAGDLLTYDLHIEHPDHLFCLVSGLVVSNSTPKAGYLGKQLALGTQRLIASQDRPMPGTGYPVDTMDAVDSVLAEDIGEYKEGTVVTPKIAKELAGKRKRLLVHSPISAIGRGDGVPRLAIGITETGRLANVGDHVGMTAAQGTSEPLSQSTISAKHVAGVVGAKGGGSSAETQKGFNVVNSFVNIPKTFPGAAPIAEEDCRVTAIKKAPQGGHYVYAGTQELYVPEDQEITVKPGDSLEAGDAVSDGLPNPADVVRLKGIGAGRAYYAQRLHKILKDSDVKALRSNMELLARGAINHVRISDDALDSDGDTGIPGGLLPGDVTDYDYLAARYVPRKASTLLPVDKSANKYLERPTLHYSIGTRVTPSVAKTLKEFNVQDVLVHDKKPAFEPEMQRLTSILNNDRDWMTRLSGFGLESQLLDATHRGLESEQHSTSYVGPLARATQFGQGEGGKF